MSHFIEVCSEGYVISQCRCPSKDKEIRRRKTCQHSTPHLGGPGPYAEGVEERMTTYRDVLTVIKITSKQTDMNSPWLHQVDLVVNDIPIDGTLDISVQQELRNEPTVLINGARPLYRTQVWFNGDLKVEDQGLLYDNDMTRTAIGKKAAR